MKIHHLFFPNRLIVATLLVGLVGCTAPTAGAPAASSSQAAETSATAGEAVTETTAPGAPPFTEDQLANTAYPVDLTDSGVVQLEGGEYNEPITEGSSANLVVSLDQVAYGDLNGDGVDDAAVVLVADSNGSGTFSYLSPVLNVDGEPEAGAAAFLGDRVEVQTLAIADEEIMVQMLTQGPDDPMCCPTLVVTNTYQLQDSQLVMSSTTNPASE